MRKDGDEDEAEFGSLFQDPDPYDIFQFDWTHDKQDIHVRLKGHKQELGQTLNSTGLTLWRASSILCDFLLQHSKEFVESQRILEVSELVFLCAGSTYSVQSQLYLPDLTLPIVGSRYGTMRYPCVSPWG